MVEGGRRCSFGAARSADSPPKERIDAACVYRRAPSNLANVAGRELRRSCPRDLVEPDRADSDQLNFAPLTLLEASGDRLGFEIFIAFWKCGNSDAVTDAKILKFQIRFGKF